VAKVAIVGILKRFRSRIGIGIALVALMALGAVGCGGGSDSSSSSADASAPTKGPVKLTIWSWDPTTPTVVEAFEKTHQNFSVDVVNVGASTDEYAKISAALAAGKGMPDVVNMEFPYVSSFVAKEALLDLSPYGAEKVAGDFAPWYMELVSQGGEGIYGLPLDAGVMGYLYRQDIFQKAGVTPPKTWDEFAAAAAKLKASDPDAVLAPFAPEWGWFTSLLWQAGSRPFELDGTNVKIAIDDAPALKVASFWDGQIGEGNVAVVPSFTNQWFSDLDRGVFAGWIAAAWGPVLVEPGSSTYGKWRVAPLPQWSAGEDVQPLYSGTVYAATSASQHPAEAAELVEYITSNEKLVTANEQETPYQFYPLKALYESKEWQNQDLPFYGPQKANVVYAEAAEHVDGSYESGPFQDYVSTAGDKYIADALKDGGSLVDALHELQTDVVAYAERQGYSVEE
jgi:multiple sugar transport system substrate-binding protein